MDGEYAAYIGLGSNLDDPAAQITRALASLDTLAGTRLVRHSRLYRNPPMGPPAQPDYVNAVAVVGTTLPPPALLAALHALERAQGRVRDGSRWGPRTIDLDLLVYDDVRIDSPELNIPHPGLAERPFVLVPLLEVAPELHVPGLGTVFELCRHLDTSTLVALTPGDG